MLRLGPRDAEHPFPDLKSCVGEAGKLRSHQESREDSGRARSRWLTCSNTALGTETGTILIYSQVEMMAGIKEELHPQVSSH